jgi:hypothetical protein
VGHGRIQCRGGSDWCACPVHSLKSDSTADSGYSTTTAKGLCCCR